VQLPVVDMLEQLAVVDMSVQLAVVDMSVQLAVVDMLEQLAVVDMLEQLATEVALCIAEAEGSPSDRRLSLETYLEPVPRPAQRTDRSTKQKKIN